MSQSDKPAPRLTARGGSLSPLRKRLVGKALAHPRGAPPGLFNYLSRRSVPFSMLPPVLAQRVSALAHSAVLASMGSKFSDLPVLVQLKKIFFVAHAMAVDELDALAERHRLFQLHAMQSRRLELVRILAITGKQISHSPSPLRHCWEPYKAAIDDRDGPLETHARNVLSSA